ncbi:hypothetical protein [Cohnella sp. GCM10027633]|uniref:hypothetical protein n=1 Tax=unclassified Cohnella TaxID=2636738 RepID=UPI003638A03E
MNGRRRTAGWIALGTLALSLCACEASESDRYDADASRPPSTAPVPTPVPSPSATAAPVAGGSIAAAALGTDTGLLIGLRADETDDPLTSPGAYRTIWISNDGEGLRERPFERVILTPKSEDAAELWAFGPVRQRTATDTIEYVVGRALPDAPRAIAIRDDPNESIVMSERLTYVGDDMVSLQAGASYWAGNGYAYSQSAWVKTFEQVGRGGPRYDRFATRWDDDAHLRMQEALGDELSEPYTDEAAGEAMEEEQGLGLARPLGDNWIVEREGRLWTPKVVGLFDYPASMYATVALPAQLLSKIQPIEETPNWTAIAITRANVRDTFLSDKRNYVLLRTDDKLLLYAYVDDAPSGEPIWTMSLKPRETVVMVKWFDGAAKPEWAERFANAYVSDDYGSPGESGQPLTPD